MERHDAARRVRRSPPATNDICVFTIERWPNAGRSTNRGRRDPLTNLSARDEHASSVKSVFGPVRSNVPGAHIRRGPRWFSGQTTRLPPRRTVFNSRQGHRDFSIWEMWWTLPLAVGFFLGHSRFPRYCIPLQRHLRLISLSVALEASLTGLRFLILSSLANTTIAINAWCGDASGWTFVLAGSTHIGCVVLFSIPIGGMSLHKSIVDFEVIADEASSPDKWELGRTRPWPVVRNHPTAPLCSVR
ncbi:hypothetical protein PR048_018323 [Dryococelus australis]|uniref:Uncharacterized protein n=1 Tax=Dryococelus australis TaxID=614101 RepID=A0ABQ9HBY4_9NEOP|nr:hypothetical protein PR048_018323 [Dryococelus australis]